MKESYGIENSSHRTNAQGKIYLHMEFKHLNFESLSNAAIDFSIDNNDPYLRAYPEFLEYFNRLDHISEHELIIGSHFTYGWMPTILELQMDGHYSFVEYFNKAKRGERLDSIEFSALKRCVNNSTVGLSKLLHFVNPEEYAIWDSKVYKFIAGKNSVYGIDRPEHYRKYLEGMKAIANHPRYHEIHVSVVNKLNANVTPMRVLELVMFQAQKEATSPLMSLFYEEPYQWGLRGDPFLWRELKKSFLNKNVKSKQEFERILITRIEKFILESLTPGKRVGVKRYNFGGMSGGYVQTDFWLNTAIPLVLDRFQKKFAN